MRLALALGGMTVEEMMDRMTHVELMDWLYFMENIEPIGEDRADLRSGIQAAATANTVATKGRGKSADDFMPIQKRRKKQAHEAMSVDDQARAVFGAMMKKPK